MAQSQGFLVVRPAVIAYVQPVAGRCRRVQWDAATEHKTPPLPFVKVGVDTMGLQVELIVTRGAPADNEVAYIVHINLVHARGLRAGA